MAGFQVTINGRFWVTAEAPEDLDRIKERCRQELNLARARKTISEMNEARRRLEETHAKQLTARTSRPGKRSSKYEAIDRALQAIDEAKPKSHLEVFNYLDKRVRNLPNAEPFVSARGWVVGFRKDPVRARSWLSKRWSVLNLAQFPRGPKQLQ